MHLRTTKAKFVLAIASLSVLFLGCEPTFVKLPTQNFIPEKQESFCAPEDFKASQGNPDSISLSWKESNLVSRYEVLRAETPFDTMEVISIVSGGSVYTDYQPKDGETYFYKLRAYSKNSKQSPVETRIISGSTLDSPYITEIKCVSMDTEVSTTVNWIMNNCSSETYEDLIQFKIIVEDNMGLKVCEPVVVDGNVYSYTFTKLTPDTNYTFTVIPVLNECDIEKKASAKVDIKTAERLIPLPADMFVARKGVEKDGISLSWQLPGFVNFKSKGKEKSGHYPVYFTLERKEMGFDDSEYVTLESYIGSNEDNAKEIVSNGKYQIFSCAEVSDEGSLSDTNRIYVSEIGSTVIDENTSFIPGSTVVYIDKTAVQGKQYEYRLRSYTDVTERCITGSGESSVAKSEGWLLSPVEIKSQTSYVKSESDPSKLKKIDVTLSVCFDDYDQTELYSYYIYSSRRDFEGNEYQEKTLFILNSLSELNETLSSPISYVNAENMDDISGYYNYRILISENCEDGTEVELATVSTLSSSTISWESDVIPDLSSFSVDDGYEDKFLLNWEKLDNVEYSLSWSDSASSDVKSISINAEGTLTTEDGSESLSVTYSEDGKNISVTHPSASGVSRVYILDGKNTESGISISNEFHTTYTLGIPDVKKTDKKYDSIKVSWKKVPAATRYDVKAFYAEEAAFLNETIFIEGTDKISSDKFNLVETSEEFELTLINPEGYDNWQKSGKDVVVEIHAINGEKDSKTVGSTVTGTFGPALINLEREEKIYSDKIVMNWDAVKGANGYVIIRTSYKDLKANTISDCDAYYYDVESSEISCSTGDLIPGSVEISLSNGKYTLTDIAVEATESSDGYQKRQGKISFGVPFGYFVIPVYEADDVSISPSFILYNKALSSSGFRMSIPQVKNSTSGYGMNVYCDKSESNTDQRIVWELPFRAEGLSGNIYRRNAGSKTNEWRIVKTTLSSGDNTVTYTLSGDDRYEAFEYIIVYNSSDQKISVPNYLIETLASEENFDNQRYPGCDEQKNKGYILATDFSASYGGSKDENGNYKADHYYSEMVTWDKWDYSKRKIGPDKAEVFALNKNNSDGWVSICTLDNDLKFKALDNDIEGKNNTLVEHKDDNKIFLTPNFKVGDKYANGTDVIKTSGPLQVLRDPYTYYKLVLTKTYQKYDNDTESIVDVTKNYAQGENIEAEDAVKAYRQITDAELIKCTMLIFSEVMENNYKKEFSYPENHGKTNYVECRLEVLDKAITLPWGRDYLIWAYHDYVHQWNSVPYSDISKSEDKDMSFLKLSDEANSKENAKAFWNEQVSAKLRIIGSHIHEEGSVGYGNANTFTVTSPIFNLESYSGKVKFCCSDGKGYFAVERGDTVTFAKEVNGKEELKQWIPVRIGDNTNYSGHDSYYGWWN